jgi:hypothetical protein
MSDNIERSTPAKAALDSPRVKFRLWSLILKEEWSRTSAIRVVAGLFFVMATGTTIGAVLRLADVSNLLVASGTLMLASFAAFQVDRDNERARSARRARLVELQVYLTLVQRSLRVSRTTAPTMKNPRIWAVAATEHFDTLQEQMIRVSNLGSQDSPTLTWATGVAMDAFLEVADRFNELAARDRVTVQFPDLQDEALRADTLIRLETALGVIAELMRRADEMT